MTDAEKECFRSYFYHIAAGRGSGEFALRHLLAPGAWAYSPLQERLQELKVRECLAHPNCLPAQALGVCMSRRAVMWRARWRDGLLQGACNSHFGLLTGHAHVLCSWVSSVHSWCNVPGDTPACLTANQPAAMLFSDMCMTCG